MPSLGLADNCGQDVLCVLHDAGATLDTVAHQRSAGHDANECPRSKLGLLRRRKGRLTHSRNKIEDGRETVGQVGEKLWKMVGRIMYLGTQPKRRSPRSNARCDSQARLQPAANQSAEQHGLEVEAAAQNAGAGREVLHRTLP